MKILFQLLYFPFLKFPLGSLLNYFFAQNLSFHLFQGCLLLVMVITAALKYDRFNIWVILEVVPVVFYLENCGDFSRSWYPE